MINWNDNRDYRCQYFEQSFGGRCFAQRDMPSVDCDGDPKHCSNDNLLNKEQPMVENEKEMVNHPEHYNNGGIECIDALAAATQGLDGIEAFCTANAIKYLWRWKWKNGAQDLDKAIWYINYLKSALDENN